jgi:hypothetical protein
MVVHQRTSRQAHCLKPRLVRVWLFITLTGVPDPGQQIRELRLFAREVMPHFRTDQAPQR